MLRWAEQRSLRLVSSANQRSPRLSQELLVGVEVQVEPGMADQPFLHFRGLVGRVVVQHQAQVQVFRDRGVDQFQEPQELLMAVPAEVLGDHRPAADVERGEQAGGAVPHAIVGHPRRDGRHDRHDRRCAVDRLHLAFSSTAITSAFSGGLR